jgi:hypothetical protein
VRGTPTTAPAQPGPRRTEFVTPQGDAAPAPAVIQRHQVWVAWRGMSKPRHRALVTAISRSRRTAPPAPQVQAWGLAQVTSLTGPSWGRNHHQHGSRSPRGPWWTGPLSEPTRTLDEARGGPMPAQLPPPPLLAVASRPRLWYVTAHPPPPRRLPPGHPLRAPPSRQGRP